MPNCRKRIRKFVRGLPDSLEDFEDTLIVLDDVIFQASAHPEVVKIFTQYRHHKSVGHDVNSMSFIRVNTVVPSV